MFAEAGLTFTKFDDHDIRIGFDRTKPAQCKAFLQVLEVLNEELGPYKDCFACNWQDPSFVPVQPQKPARGFNQLKTNLDRTLDRVRTIFSRAKSGASIPQVSFMGVPPEKINSDNQDPVPGEDELAGTVHLPEVVFNLHLIRSPIGVDGCDISAHVLAKRFLFEMNAFLEGESTVARLQGFYLFLKERQSALVKPFAIFMACVMKVIEGDRLASETAKSYLEIFCRKQGIDHYEDFDRCAKSHQKAMLSAAKADFGANIENLFDAFRAALLNNQRPFPHVLGRELGLLPHSFGSGSNLVERRKKQFELVWAAYQLLHFKLVMPYPTLRRQLRAMLCEYVGLPADVAEVSLNNAVRQLMKRKVMLNAVLKAQDLYQQFIQNINDTESRTDDSAVLQTATVETASAVPPSEDITPADAPEEPRPSAHAGILADTIVYAQQALDLYMRKNRKTQLATHWSIAAYMHQEFGKLKACPHHPTEPRIDPLVYLIGFLNDLEKQHSRQLKTLLRYVLAFRLGKMNKATMDFVLRKKLPSQHTRFHRITDNAHPVYDESLKAFLMFPYNEAFPSYTEVLQAIYPSGNMQLIEVKTLLERLRIKRVSAGEERFESHYLQRRSEEHIRQWAVTRDCWRAHFSTNQGEFYDMPMDDDFNRLLEQYYVKLMQKKFPDIGAIKPGLKNFYHHQLMMTWALLTYSNLPAEHIDRHEELLKFFAFIQKQVLLYWPEQKPILRDNAETQQNIADRILTRFQTVREQDFFGLDLTDVEAEVLITQMTVQLAKGELSQYWDKSKQSAAEATFLKAVRALHATRQQHDFVFNQLPVFMTDYAKYMSTAASAGVFSYLGEFFPGGLRAEFQQALKPLRLFKQQNTDNGLPIQLVCDLLSRACQEERAAYANSLYTFSPNEIMSMMAAGHRPL